MVLMARERCQSKGAGAANLRKEGPATIWQVTLSLSSSTGAPTVFMGVENVQVRGPDLTFCVNVRHSIGAHHAVRCDFPLEVRALVWYLEGRAISWATCCRLKFICLQLGVVAV